MTLDLKRARAAGRDAGDRAMRAAGRGAWDASAWDIAAETTARLLQAAFQADGLDDAQNDTARGSDYCSSVPKAGAASCIWGNRQTKSALPS